MIKILDRQLVFSYVKSYLVCLISLMSLFVIVDLFQNLDSFWEHNKTLQKVFAFIGAYYAAKVMLIFDRLSEGIVLMAAMFTVAWMQRNNEILPLLSAGVSTRRIIRPVLLASSSMVLLAVLNQELVLPTIDPDIIENRGDAKGERELAVKGGFESNGILVSGDRAYKKDLTIKGFTVVFPNTPDFEGLQALYAEEAKYRPAGFNGRPYGGWEMTKVKPAQQPQDISRRKDNILENPVQGKYFLRTTDIDFRTATRPKNWYQFVPTLSLLDELGRIDHSKLSSVAVLFHTRITRPLLGVLLVFMGLSIILRDQNRNVFISTGLCLLLCAVFFLFCFGCKYLGDYEYLTPIIAAWLPILLFGPLSTVMFDAVHT
jgi:lipopolysaccharide export system permease protein